jgi:hypothetical protein
MKGVTDNVHRRYRVGRRRIGFLLVVPLVLFFCQGCNISNSTLFFTSDIFTVRLLF